MPYSGPRRAPLTGPQRERNTRNALGAALAEGATDSRVVGEPKQARIYQPPGATQAIEAEGHYDVSDTSGFTGAIYQAPFDTDTGTQPTGVFATGTAAIDVLVDGWFGAHAIATIGSADPGDVFKLILNNGGSGEGVGYGIADGSGNVDVSAVCSIVGSFARSGLFNVFLRQTGGTGVAPSLNSVSINLVKYAGSLTL